MRNCGAPEARRSKLLLAWGNPYVFAESIVPLLAPLARTFDVDLMLVDYFLSAHILQSVERARDEGLLKRVWIVPEYGRTLRLHAYMRRHLGELRRARFDAFLSLSFMQPFERYIVDAVLPRHAAKVCFSPSTAFLMEKRDLVERLLENQRVPPELFERPSGLVPLRSLRHEAWQTLRGRPTVPHAARIGKHFVFRAANQLHRRVRAHVDRVLLPAIVAGRTFRLRKYDWLTQMGTDQFDAALFCDPMEARAHAALFESAQVFVVRHPSEGACRCYASRGAKKAILSPLGGTFSGRTNAPAAVLDAYVRDLKAATRESGATEVHLRPHPRESGPWPAQLRDHLRANGIEAALTDRIRPLREIVCDYAGVVGIASASLRDARAACDTAFVVGLCAVSKEWFADPRFVMGASPGIGWIEDDGTYPAGTFNPATVKTCPESGVAEVVRQLVDARTSGVRLPAPETVGIAS